MLCFILFFLDFVCGSCSSGYDFTVVLSIFFALIVTLFSNLFVPLLGCNDYPILGITPNTSSKKNVLPGRDIENRKGLHVLESLNLGCLALLV